MIKERPILFSAPMVRALLDGSKTQTRRACKLEVRAGMPEPEWASLLSCCPHGQPGDRLWVREHYWTTIKVDHIPPRAILPSTIICYAADGEYNNADLRINSANGKLRPGMFMCRWMSRTLLEIVSVRVERLHEITRGDCMAEGCPFPNIAHQLSPKQWYRDLWESINGHGSWALNPWVWVIEFKRVKP